MLPQPTMKARPSSQPLAPYLSSSLFSIIILIIVTPQDGKVNLFSKGAQHIDCLPNDNFLMMLLRLLNMITMKRVTMNRMMMKRMKMKRMMMKMMMTTMT